MTMRPSNRYRCRDLGPVFTAVCLAGLLAFVCSARGAAPASVPSALGKDELMNQLDTQQAQLTVDEARMEMERAKVNFEQTQRLFDGKIVTIDQLDKSRQVYDQAKLAHDKARIELDKTRLAFLKGATFVTVVNAKKYRAPDGQVMVSVKLRNSSDINKARVAMGETEAGSRDKLASLLKVDNVVVSLRNTAIVCDPYQQIVPELKYGEEVTLEYRLLKRDVESLTVDLDFQETHKEYAVFLTKDTGQDLATIASSQYAQEGTLGTKISYDLELERLANTEQSFSLVVLNLPRAIAFAFIDPESKARVTHLRFTEERSSQRLLLEISIPDKLEANLIGSSLDFTVVITRPAELVVVGQLQQKYEDKPIPAEELAKIKGARLGLKLIPTGVGRMEILISNLFKEVKRGEPIDVRFTLLNSGTLALRSVTPKLNLPTDWEADVDPKSVPLIDPGDQSVVSLHLRPPKDVSVGEYTLKIGAEGNSGINNIDALEKNFAVRLAAESNVTGTVVLVTVLVVLVLGIAVASIKISRR